MTDVAQGVGPAAALRSRQEIESEYQRVAAQFGHNCFQISRITKECEALQNRLGQLQVEPAADEPKPEGQEP